MNADTMPVPKLIQSVAEVRPAIKEVCRQGKRVGLVPTMGALHAGHLSLVEASRRECDFTAVTIFVNPTQFAPGEDFERYPRDLERDQALLADAGADLVFAPSVEAMYRPGHDTNIEPGEMARALEGASRPTHFRGVATVVSKLFNLLPADVAFFGQKDYQQTQVIRRMVADLNVPIEIRVCPIVREADGLAMSSRNAYLDDAQRQTALSLWQSLRDAAAAVAGGERNADALRRRMQETMQSAGADVDYAEVVEAGTVTPVRTIGGPVVLLVAARVGKTRLIDNWEVR